MRRDRLVEVEVEDLTAQKHEIEGSMPTTGMERVCSLFFSLFFASEKKNLKLARAAQIVPRGQIPSNLSGRISGRAISRECNAIQTKIYEEPLRSRELQQVRVCLSRSHVELVFWRHFPCNCSSHARPGCDSVRRNFCS